MKCIAYFLLAIASTCLVILLSLSSCSPKHQATTSPPMVMNDQPKQKPPASQTTADATVKIRNFKFEPANLAIAVGKTVRFINLDEEPHTATATDGSFNSQALDTDQFWNYTATKPGIYDYICAVHPFMKGTLTVTPPKS